MSRFLWTQKEDIGPSARFGHAMTYDTVRSRTILFGGNSLIGGQATSVNDTWEWDGLAWTKQQDTGPSQRWHHSLVLDLVHNCTVLFGGDAGGLVAVGDTWSWDADHNVRRRPLL